MDHTAVLAAYDRQIRQNLDPDGPGVVVERVDGVVRRVGGPHDWNGVVWSDLDESTADAAIAAQVRHFTERGLEFEWKAYSHDLPADLPDRLLAAGFTPEAPETLMVAAVAELPLDAGPPEGVRLVPVTDAAGVRLMVDVHEQAFGTDGTALGKQLLDQLTTAPDTIAAVVALAGDVPVSSARLEFRPGTDFAGLWGGGTVAEWRGRGIYRALIAHRARIAADHGVRHLQVDASDQSRPILRRLGFTELGTTTPYVHKP
ncbi:GNAT family N-acetyltransferase [Streptomyces flavofungini]|uniref:GNAT family N-acetyltransferase n=1 Tax=Streptomyces flavofungini TaxID=68200 RepID=UPI0025B1FB9B|nr:GNAT family N-acetyltransferase [Streptomyces flavofungini]WJV50317.1 GNAT family N-acetyltransferase [Streptomyces flavofungini]